MKGERAFVDTNVLLYSTDDSEADRQAIASTLLALLTRSASGVISPQVVNEFGHNLIRKFGRTSDEAARLCLGLQDFALAPSSVDSVVQALRLMKVASLSFWDACIVAVALREGCSILYTEDMNAGQVIEGLRIVNPFSG